MISLKITRKDLRIVVYFISILITLYSLKFPEFAKEILIGLFSSILATIVLDSEVLVSPPSSPEEVSRLSSIERKLDEVLSLLKRKQ